jgi:hypothetical protein
MSDGTETPPVESLMVGCPTRGDPRGDFKRARMSARAWLLSCGAAGNGGKGFAMTLRTLLSCLTLRRLPMLVAAAILLALP